jgi:hypothetical protein
MAQIAEIEAHRARLIDSVGHDVSWEAAAHDWITHYAADWRRQRLSEARQATAAEAVEARQATAATA